MSSVHSCTSAQVGESYSPSTLPKDRNTTESTNVLFLAKSVQFNLNNVTAEHCKIPSTSDKSTFRWWNGFLACIGDDVYPFLLFSPDLYLSNNIRDYKLQDWLDMDYTFVIGIQRLLSCIVENNELECVVQGGTRGPIFRFRLVETLESLVSLLREQFLFYPCESLQVGLFIRKEEKWLEPLPKDTEQRDNTTHLSDEEEVSSIYTPPSKPRFQFPIEVAERLANIARITREARDELLEKLVRSPKSRNMRNDLSLEKLQKCTWPLDVMNESLLEQEEEVRNC